MTILSITVLASVLSTTGIAALVLWQAPKRQAYHLFALGMLCLGVESGLGGLAHGLDGAGFQIPWLLSTFFSTAPWLLFSFSYSRFDGTAVVRRWRLRLVFMAAGLFVVAIGLRNQLLLSPDASSKLAATGFRLGVAGIGLNLLTVVVCVGILTNLERTFRDSAGIMRWRLKYVILGLGTLFLFKFYQASQSLLYSAMDLSHRAVAPGVILLSCLLLSVGLWRSKSFEVSIYASRSALMGSLTVAFAGAYLMIVGVLAQVFRRAGEGTDLPLKAFVILLALVGLAMALLSERFRRQLHRFVSRHFHRPVHDYRIQWMTFAAQTASELDEPRFCRAVVNWGSEAFRSLSVTIWLPDEDRAGLRLGGSTSLTERDAHLAEADDTDWKAVFAELLAHPEPLDLDASTATWLVPLRRLSPGVSMDTGGRLCLPLIGGGELLGILLIGERVGGTPFEPEDFDLLQCIGGSVAASLLNINLSRRLLGARELEAFQTMSAFFVHDLKNMASTLSLMLQNFETHFDNPEFRQDALRAVGKSVRHLDELIGRLGLLRQDLQLKRVEADFSRMVASSVEQAGPLPQIRMSLQLEPNLRFSFDPEQLQKVVLNLVLNSRDAITGPGEVSVTTSSSGGWAILTVTDNGCGIPLEFIRRSLFRPFRTTKQRGIGIGMFQSRMIVEAHRGRIEVDSTVGVGTTFRVVFPLI